MKNGDDSSSVEESQCTPQALLGARSDTMLSSGRIAVQLGVTNWTKLWLLSVVGTVVGA